MDAQQLAGRRLVAAVAIEGALDHASFQHLDGLMQRDVASQKMLHQPLEFFFHLFDLNSLFKRLPPGRFDLSYVFRKPSFNSCGAMAANARAASTT